MLLASSSYPPSSSGDSRRSITDWDETEVQSWLSKIGFPQYESQIREHNISGEVLMILDAESLKELGVSTVGQRLSILKAVYQTKLACNVPIEADHYVPPSEAEERQEKITVDKLHTLVKEQGERLRNLENENQRLGVNLQTCMEELTQMRNTQPRSPSFKWAQYVKPARSPTKPDISYDSPHPSPQRTEHDIPQVYPTPLPPPFAAADRSVQPRTQPSSQASVNNSPNDSNLLMPTPPKTARSESNDNLKSFKVSLDDPAWKVLPAALKKYRINNDDWQNYAMFICYGSTERCLSYDEKPLLLFQKLKDAKKNPVFMLKHIRDIRSPIAVAQQKHAQRKASDASSLKTSESGGHSRSNSKPAKLRVHGLPTTTPPLMTAASTQPGWPEVMSPAVERNGEEVDATKSRLGNGSTDDGADAVAAPASHLSYAVAIYPYMAEQEDEFDVVVGDTFIIISRAPGWWVVQRDPTGSGVVDADTSKQGWVPAGCLLETNVPVASAVAEATAGQDRPTSKTPILPLSIISTSFPGVALTDYRKKGEEELDLTKDDLLRVFKKYNHWSYAVKEDKGDRGWVPSWFIGKVSTTVTPATPTNTITPINQPNTVLLESDTAGTHNAVSPMSSAFPQQLIPSRTTTVI